MRGGGMRRGFTLLEMMAVMAIIGLLASLLLGVLASVRMAAKKSKARSDVMQIRTAWEQFLQDYSRLPLPASGVTAMGPTAIAILGADTNSPTAMKENPRKNVYMNFRQNTTYYCDPWGAHNTTGGVYHLAFDDDYDNDVVLPGALTVKGSIAVWSDGPNRKNENGRGDDLVSWRR